jgi:hypothetical protein
MPTIDSDYDYPQATQYWDLVKKTLKQVFSLPDPILQDALRGAEVLEQEVSKSLAQEQLLFYHAEPLDVAADLAGRPPVGEQIIRKYNNLAADIGWTLSSTAQQPSKVAHIGWLSPNSSLEMPLVEPFRQRLRELGLVRATEPRY